MSGGPAARTGASRAARGSAKAARFRESVIREMTRVARKHGAINLAQGFPDFAAPAELKDAACRWIHADLNQYATTWGSDRMRAAIGRWMLRRRGVEIDADAQVTVCCGGTEGMIAAMMGVLDPGEEVLVPEPFYENYGPDGILSGATPRCVPLAAGWRLDVGRLRDACTPRTAAPAARASCGTCRCGTADRPGRGDAYRCWCRCRAGAGRGRCASACSAPAPATRASPRSRSRASPAPSR